RGGNGGNRPAARVTACSGNHRRHLARRPARNRRAAGSGRSRGGGAARSDLGRIVSGRAGASRSASGRAGRHEDRRHRDPAPYRRFHHIACRASIAHRTAGGCLMAKATILYNTDTLTVTVPMTFKKRGGRKLVI